MGKTTIVAQTKEKNNLKMRTNTGRRKKKQKRKKGSIYKDKEKGKREGKSITL